MLSGKGELGASSQEEACLKLTQGEGKIKAILFRSHMRKKLVPISCFYVSETTAYNYTRLVTYSIIYTDTNICTRF